MESRRAAVWQRPVLIAIAVGGIAISGYLTATHLSAVPLMCTIGSVVNCTSVTHSAYSVIPGTSVPISVLGIVWFAISGTLGLISSPSPVATNSPSPLAGEGTVGVWGGRFGRLHLAWAGLGVVVVLYLVFVEIVVLHQICEWCTAVHLLVLATFVLALRRVQQPSR